MAQRPLSHRAAAVLEAVVKFGPFENAANARLSAVAGAGRLLYDALLVLNDRRLVRWDQGGKNLRATTSGRELLRQSHYRRMLSDGMRPIKSRSAL